MALTTILGDTCSPASSAAQEKYRYYLLPLSIESLFYGHQDTTMAIPTIKKSFRHLVSVSLRERPGLE